MNKALLVLSFALLIAGAVGAQDNMTDDDPADGTTAEEEAFNYTPVVTLVVVSAVVFLVAKYGP